MALYKLESKKEDLSDGILIKANKEKIDYEKDFENWLENSPHLLSLDGSNSTIIWIGRQVTASEDEYYRFPDLIGIDGNGDLVIAELKKGKTPREVVAQTLEYAAWGEKLTYDELNNLALKYYDNHHEFDNMDLKDIYMSVFYPDNDEPMNIKFNTNQKMIIVAEEISTTVLNVAKYLNKSFDISCIQYEVFKNTNDEIFLSTEVIEKSGSLVKKHDVSGLSQGRWNGNVPVKEVVKNAVLKVTEGNYEKEFAPKEIINLILQDFPDFNISTARCQIIQDCVNHSSRKHYKGGQQDLYYLISKGKYRMYDKTKDGRWDSEGKQV